MLLYMAKSVVSAALMHRKTTYIPQNWARGLYSTANDPQPQLIPRPVNDPQNGPQMILDRK